jgi:hypothetical protein
LGLRIKVSHYPNSIGPGNNWLIQTKLNHWIFFDE